MRRDELLPGTLELLILKTVARGRELHGYEIAETIQRVSEDVLWIEEGSLYPALQRMLRKGWVSAKWGTTAGNRRARYYRLTAAGRRALGEELESWRRFATGLEAVLRAT